MSYHCATLCTWIWVYDLNISAAVSQNREISAVKYSVWPNSKGNVAFELPATEYHKGFVEAYLWAI